MVLEEYIKKNKIRAFVFRKLLQGTGVPSESRKEYGCICPPSYLDQVIHEVLENVPCRSYADVSYDLELGFIILIEPSEEIDESNLRFLSEKEECQPLKYINL